MDLSGNTYFDGPAGRIEAILKEPPGVVTRAAVICHPHPLYGGTMHNKVVYRVARAFFNSGFATLRFNFRGVGKSGGKHDYGQGEQDDLIAALDFAELRYPNAEFWLAGFSFGASVMFKVGCREKRARVLVAVGLPATAYEYAEEPCDKPKLFVQGSLDQFGAAEDLGSFVERLTEPAHLGVIAGADHFFEGHLDELEDAIADFIYRSST